MTAVATGRPGTFLRRAWSWAAIGAFLLVTGIVLTILGGSPRPGVALSPTDPSPEGSRALAEVLRRHGVEVIVPATLADAVAAARQPGTTLLLDDPAERIGSFGNAAIDRTGARIVLLEATRTTLESYGDVVRPGAFRSGGGAASADCDYGPVRRAGSIVGDSWVYQVLVGAGTTACWRDADGAPRVVVHGTGSRELVVLGTTGLLQNQNILRAGDAAFALGVLGATPRLVWFQPTERAGWSGDGGGTGTAGAGPATIGDVTPIWVTPVLLLLVATAIAAAVWRGRRFGPLLVEPLPAIVPADETVRGRARLYARARARLRALDALRSGTIGRLGAALGLPSTASVEEVAAAVAAITERPTAQLLGLLRDVVPGSDRDLIRCSDELLRLETDLTGRMKP